MRIIGYIEHPEYKITVFKMDTRLSVKFETAALEQTYKFRQQDGLEDLEDVRRLVNEALLTSIARSFRLMEVAQMQALSHHLPAAADDEFDTII